MSKSVTICLFVFDTVPALDRQTEDRETDGQVLYNSNACCKHCMLMCGKNESGTFLLTLVYINIHNCQITTFLLTAQAVQASKQADIQTHNQRLV